MMMMLLMELQISPLSANEYKKHKLLHLFKTILWIFVVALDGSGSDGMRVGVLWMFLVLILT